MDVSSIFCGILDIIGPILTEPLSSKVAREDQSAAKGMEKKDAKIHYENIGGPSHRSRRLDSLIRTVRLGAGWLAASAEHTAYYAPPVRAKWAGRRSGCH
jgi:hypothetical protein